MRIAVIAVMILLSHAGAAVLAAAPAELEPYAFLLGEWAAAGSGQPGAGSGTAVFSRGLQDRVLVRTSFAEYPAAEGRPASRHDDLMVIYAGPGGTVRADYYDNEGHVIRYVAAAPAAGRAVFTSEGAGGAPAFRLSYALDAAGVLAGEFAMSPPGSPGAFKPYLAWSSRKTPGSSPRAK